MDRYLSELWKPVVNNMKYFHIFKGWLGVWAEESTSQKHKCTRLVLISIKQKLEKERPSFIHEMSIIFLPSENIYSFLYQYVNS